MNETIKRALSGIVYVVLLLSCISFSKISLALLFAFLLIIAVFEFCKIVDLNFWICLPFILLAYYFLWDKYNFPNATSTPIVSFSFWFNPRIVITLISSFISFKLIYYIFKKSKLNFKKNTNYLLLIGYIVIPLVLINYIAMGENGYNPKIILSILILIWANDTFAYLVGKNFGKNKLFPSISPKKTIEGFIGGMIFTIISGILLSKFFIQSKILYIWIIIAIIVSVFSTLGDLIESKFKRIAGIKDSGNIMPGHGGILDRLDSIIFVIPFINLYFLISYIFKYYVS